MSLKILYEDATVLVVDKPAGLTAEHIASQTSCILAHRLDKDTSGVLVLAKTQGASEKLQQEFWQRRVEKIYICLIEGGVKEESGITHTLLARSPADRRKQRTYVLEERKEGRREAITQWRVLGRFEGFALLEIIPKTGRKHQIRAHMASLNHPVAGDKLYGFKNQRMPEGLQRQFLHANSLKIVLPDGKKKEFTSELPKDLQKVLAKLDYKS